MTVLAPPYKADTVEAVQRVSHSTIRWIAGTIALIVAMQAYLAINRSINWDEFYFYGQVVDYAEGGSLRPIQTFHVHLFSWIPGVVQLGVDGIVIGRLFMLVLSLVTAGSIALIAHRFVSREHSLIAALLWLAAGFTMQHGWSFRTDPLATAALMAALAILARVRLSILAIILSGTLIGVAGMITLKSILLLPAFVGIAWLRWSETKFDWLIALRIAAIPAIAGAIFAALYVWHGHMLSTDGDRSASQYAESVSGSMLFAGIPIYLHYAAKSVLTSIPAIVVIVFAIGALKRRTRHEALALLGLILPLISVLIYRNTLPYFYPMMLAPVIAGCAIGIPVFVDRYNQRLLVIIAAVSGAVIWFGSSRTHIDQQRDIQRAAQEIFPAKVGYLDFPDMLPDHHKANGFLTRWGIESASAKGDGHYRRILENEVVPLLLTAEPEFNPTLLAIMLQWPQQNRFHQGDQNLLRMTYRQFWGPFWLAGTEIDAGGSQEYEVMVPGPYTVTGAGLSIDGNTQKSGNVITLERGSIVLSNTGPQEAGIVWGERLEAPERAPPERPFWNDF